MRRSGTAGPCCSTRETVTPVRSSAPAFCACSTSCCVELRPVDQPEQHLLGAAGAGEAAVERERHRVHPVPQRQFEAGRQRVARRADDAAAARLVAGQLGLLQQQHAPPRDRRRVGGRGTGGSRADHDDVPHLVVHVVRRTAVRAATRCSRWSTAPDQAACRTCLPHPTARVADRPLWEDRQRPSVHRVQRITTAPTRSVPMSSNPVAETVASLMPRARTELAELVAFKSVADFDAVPEERERGRAALGRRRAARRGLPGRGAARHPGRHAVGVRLPARPRGRADRAAVRPLRRAAAAGRGRLDHPAVRADRARRPLVRARRRRLQGRRHHAPARAARPARRTAACRSTSR